MSCAGLNFIILKINDIDVTNLTHDETVEIFLKLNDPIIIKVRRRRPDDSHNKLNLFDDDWARTLKTHPTRSSVECQTDFSLACIKNPEHSTDSSVSNNVQLCQGMIDGQSIFAHCFAPEIDIEEVTLQKSCSDEKLGLTVSYSSANGSTSISASDDDDPDSDNLTDNDDANDGDDNNENSCGDIYICDILPGSIAARDGRLRQGDQIIQINGKHISSKDETESLFAEHKNSITLLVSRCVYTDDEFMDSAIYCDDKDQNTGISLSLDCEPSTYSSKSSLRSFSEAYKQQIPLQAITAIETNTCDHANIRAQLESVNKEISLLNSKISHMKLQKSSSLPPIVPALQPPVDISQTLELLAQTDKIASSVSPIPSKSHKQAEGAANSRKGVTVSVDQSMQNASQPQNQSPNMIVNMPSDGVRQPVRPMMEIEHIYETIPEDSETYSYYCSPYDERKDQSWIEQWLKSQDIADRSYLTDSGHTALPPHPTTGPQPSITLSATKTTTATKRDFYLNQSVLSRIHKNNSSGDDYENSSSAYNTGDSCTSNALTFEIKADDKNQSSSTLVFQPYTDQFDSIDNCKQCQLRCRREKTNFKVGRKSLAHMGLPGEKGSESTATVNRIQPQLLQSQHHPPQTSSLSVKNTANTTRPTKFQNKLFRKAVAQNQQSVRDTTPSRLNDRPSFGNTKAGLQKQLCQPSAIASVEATPPADTNPTMAWKVKRRTDGTRYIVRRPVRRSSSASSCQGQRNNKPQQQHYLHQPDVHKDRPINEHDEIISSTSSGVVVKDEIITITAASSNLSSGYRYSSLMASSRQNDNRKARSISERTKQRRQTLQIKQQSCQQSSPGVSQVSSTCTRTTSRRHIQTQWVI